MTTMTKSKIQRISSIFFIVGTICFLLLGFLANTSLAASENYVTKLGKQLYLKGKNFRYIGIGRHNLATFMGPVYTGCSTAFSKFDLDSYFSELQSLGINAIRFDIYQSYTNAGQDFSRTDYIINELAPRYNIHLIPVLDNHFSACTKGPEKSTLWYGGGYETEPWGDEVLTYKNYVQMVVERYKNSPSVLMWDLINEPIDINSDYTDCALTNNIFNFVSDMSSYVKSIDNNHLITIGTMGGGECGLRGDEYIDVFGLDNVDVLDTHDYGYPSTPLSNGTGIWAEATYHDSSWTFYSAGDVVNPATSVWNTISGVISQPANGDLNTVSLRIHNPVSDYDGPVYIDDIIFTPPEGSPDSPISYDFEDGTLQGWGFDPVGASSLVNSSEKAYGDNHSLRLDLLPYKGWGLLYLNNPSTVSTGWTLSFKLFVPDSSSFRSAQGNILASNLLDKPIVFNEVGIRTRCAEANCFSLSDRAFYMQEKLNAFFGSGGSGFLIWSYRNNDNLRGEYDFDLNDPMSQVLQNATASYLFEQNNEQPAALFPDVGAPEDSLAQVVVRNNLPNNFFNSAASDNSTSDIQPRAIDPKSRYSEQNNSSAKTTSPRSSKQNLQEKLINNALIFTTIFLVLIAVFRIVRSINSRRN
jgi:hypothetical protein